MVNPRMCLHPADPSGALGLFCMQVPGDSWGNEINPAGFVLGGPGSFRSDYVVLTGLRTFMLYAPFLGAGTCELSFEIYNAHTGTTIGPAIVVAPGHLAAASGVWWTFGRGTSTAPGLVMDAARLVITCTTPSNLIFATGTQITLYAQ